MVMRNARVFWRAIYWDYVWKLRRTDWEAVIVTGAISLMIGLLIGTTIWSHL